MKYAFLCMLTVTFSYTHAQSNFLKNYKSFDSLTKNLATYNVQVIVNDSLMPYHASVTEELIETYKFLASKKRVKTAAEFLITVRLDEAFTEEPRFVFLRKENPGADDELSRYQLTFYYKTSLSLLVHPMSGDDYVFDTVSFKESNYSFFKDIYTNPQKINTTKYENPFTYNIEYQMEAYKKKFGKRASLFLYDFSKLLKMYRQK